MSDLDQPVRAEHDATAQFVRLLGEHERQLRAYVLTLVPHWADADEIVQQTRVRIWEQFHHFDPNKDFGAWSRSIAYYLVLAMREQAGRYPQLRDQEFLESVSREFEQFVPQADRFGRALSVCLSKLEKIRRDLVLRYHSGRESMQEIASEIGIQPDTLKSRVHRARVALAKCIERELSGEVRS